VPDGRLTKQQGLALTAAFLGWLFDGLDGYLYVMVAGKLVATLLGTEVSNPEVTVKAGVIQGFFLIGWAIGGAVFGRIGDRLGRSRTLTLTILTYAVFTGLSFFATSWWHLLVFRFIAALGIGGEWAAGSALVAETIHPRHRSWVSAGLQSGYMVGCIAASYTSMVFAEMDPRTCSSSGYCPPFSRWGSGGWCPTEEWHDGPRRRPPACRGCSG
jgi:MFS family permease